MHTVLGPSTISRAFLAFLKTCGFGPFSQFYELLHTVLGPSIVSRALLTVIKTRGFGPFSHLSQLLHTALGSVNSFESISGSHQNSWIWSFLAVLSAIAYCFGVRRQFRGHFVAVMKTRGFGPFSLFNELLHTVLGSVDNFEGISGSRQNPWIWSFLGVI